MNIQDQPCLVVGGGQIASRKVFMLERAGGKVTVVSPDLEPELQ
ncbi:MAG: NAD(P)-dependent oxidoreductase, partial [Gammaproteobacteria bacterium]